MRPGAVLDTLELPYGARPRGVRKQTDAWLESHDPPVQLGVVVPHRGGVLVLLGVAGFGRGCDGGGWRGGGRTLGVMVDDCDQSARVTAAADDLGLTYEVTRHGRVGSLAEAAAARGIEPHQLLKTMVVRVSDGDHRFVLVPGDREIAWPKLRALLGVSRLSMPSAEAALGVTGFVRGTITPLGSATPLPVVADASIRGTVSIGGGAHGVGLSVDAAALVAALGATVADVTEPTG